MKIKYADMFCGIGGFRLALNHVDSECVFSSDYNKDAQVCYKAIHGEDPYPNDIRELDYTTLPDMDLLCGGFPCFTGETLVTVYDNNYVQIKDIKVGDYVLTHQNRYRKVTNFFNQGEKIIWNIEVTGCPTIHTTFNHRFYVKCDDKIDWVSTQELTPRHLMGVIMNRSLQWMPISSVVQTSRKETVYDIEVEEDHSFIANHCIAHNCAKFSMAGDRMGFESPDPRGQMFWELAKMLEIKKPKMFWFENVKGLLNHDKGNSFGTILRKLDELGYDVEWHCPNAKDFGYPIIRERVFIVGHLRDKPTPRIFPLNPTSYTYDTETSIFQYRRGYFRRFDGYVPTLTASMGTGGNNVPLVIQYGRLRKLTPREVFRLQGIEDNVIDAMINTGLSNSALYERAGRSIFQPYAIETAKRIYKALTKKESV